jgi:isopentenyl diphosphate isomerase/L-lactate dehydrogenase-like FMN-dependent dehydrogenase
MHIDPEVTIRSLKRVKELGYKGIMLTVDSPVVGKRERDEKANIITQVCDSLS